MSDPVEKVVHLEKQSLKRVLTAADLFSVGYGDVGSSLYYALGLTALYALGATPLALAIAGFVFMCTTFTYAEMATTFPESGGSATYARHAFNDFVSFIAGWGLLLDYILTVAISAFAIPPYLNHVIPINSSTTVHIVSTIVIIVLLFLVNVIGVKYSGRLSLILAVLTILSQLFIIILAALVVLNLPFVMSHLRINVAGADWSPDWWQFLKGTTMAMVAYTGIESVAQLASEAKKPSLTIPRSIRWTMITLVVLYFGISVTGLSVISPQELGTKYIDDPIAGIVAQLPFGGKWLAPWFGIIAALILLIASNAGLIGCSRVTFAMGEYYQVPHILYKMHRKFRTPYVSLAVFTILPSIVVLLSRGQILFLADLYNFGAQLAFFFAHVSLLVLRWKKPTLQRPYKAPLNIPLGKERSFPLTALIGAMATFGVWLMVVITKPEGRSLGFLWLIVGAAMYFYYRKKKAIAPFGKLSIEKIKIPSFHKMHVKHILAAVRWEGNTDAFQMACQMAHSFHAKITAVYIIEIAPAIPIQAHLEDRERMAESALKRAEAIAREYALTADLKLVRARSIRGALLELAIHSDCDLVILGTRKEELRERMVFAAEMERLLKEIPCRVLFCKS